MAAAAGQPPGLWPSSGAGRHDLPPNSRREELSPIPETAARGYTYPASTGHTRLWEHFEELASDIDADVATVVTAVADKVTHVFKTTSESVTSSTTVQNDNELFVTLPVGLWRVEAMLMITGAAAADFKCVWDFTGGNTVTPGRLVLGPAPSTTDATDTNMRAVWAGATSAAIYGLDGSSTIAAREDMIWDVTSEGVLTLQWAQNTSNGTATNLLAGSRLYVTKLG